MSKTKNIGIDINDINSLIKSLKGLSTNLNKLQKEIPLEVATVGLDYLNQEYSNISNPNITDITTSISQIPNGARIISHGKDVFYEEFGTGDEGTSVGDGKGVSEARSRFNLNDYNSGKYIRPVNPNNQNLKDKGIVSGNYWTYKKNGEIHYTQGVKPGLEMFNTANYLRNKGTKDVLEKKVSDVLSKV